MTKTDSCWQTYSGQQEFSFTLANINAPFKMVSLFLKDKANNISESMTATINIDVTPPDEIDIQVYDSDAVPDRTTYTNNLGVHLKALAACPSETKYMFIKASLAANTPSAPTAADIVSGSSGSNSKLILRNHRFKQDLGNIISGLVTEGEAGPVDLKLWAWTIDLAGNVSQASTFSSIQYYTEGHFFELVLNDGSNPKAGEYFDVTVKKVDSDGALLTSFNGVTVNLAFTWVNEVASVVPGFNNEVLATADRTFSYGAFDSTGTAFVIYNIARGELASNEHTVLKVTATIAGEDPIEILSDAFTLDEADIDHIKIVDGTEYNASAVDTASLTVGDTLELWAASYDIYGNWIELVNVSWSSTRVSGSGDNYIYPSHFTKTYSNNTIYTAVIAGDGVAIKASHTYTNNDGDEATIEDSTGVITVTE